MPRLRTGLAALLFGPRLNRPVGQKILIGGALCAQLGDRAIEGVEPNAELRGLLLAAPAVLEVRKPGELYQQRIVARVFL